jgi:BirA family biotin operon repressor/biotin-[acetyl-CoA-carboxylase] ligase
MTLKLPFVQTILYYPELGSTSDAARRLLSLEDRSDPLPLLVVADRQTQGRGRGSNAWFSDCGSLTFTLVLDPGAYGLSPAQEASLALVAACGIARALEPGWLDSDAAEIRWPNDVEVEGRKLAGLLLERIATPQGGRLLLGIGLNVSTDFRQAPVDVQHVATSLRACGRGHGPESPRDLLVPVLQSLEELILRMGHDNGDLCELWQARDSLRGRPVRVQLPDRLLEGTGAGIDELGRLRVATSNGIETLVGGIVLR